MRTPGVLRKMRSKETEADYRYFREPDLLPVRLTKPGAPSWTGQMPELPSSGGSALWRSTGCPNTMPIS
jgi:aspartyl-tRNA(Asn)/glutamyl-tRNA(Gln) amidotransferase subunit B